MAVDGAADVSIFVVVRIVRWSRMLLVKHQTGWEELEIRDGTNPRNMIVGAVELLVARHFV
jgi:hypothetical protein